jgi:hypothetical protein
MIRSPYEQVMRVYALRISSMAKLLKIKSQIVQFVPG